MRDGTRHPVKTLLSKHVLHVLRPHGLLWYWSSMVDYARRKTVQPRHCCR